MAEASKIRIIPLGGVEEIGKNIYVIEYGKDIIVVDCGSIFPKEDMLGIDLAESSCGLLRGSLLALHWELPSSKQMFLSSKSQLRLFLQP